MFKEKLPYIGKTVPMVFYIPEPSLISAKDRLLYEKTFATAVSLIKKHGGLVAPGFHDGSSTVQLSLTAETQVDLDPTHFFVGKVYSFTLVTCAIATGVLLIKPEHFLSEFRQGDQGLRTVRLQPRTRYSVRELIKLFTLFDLRDRRSFPGFSTLFFSALERSRALPSRSAASMKEVIKHRIKGRVDRLVAIVEDGNAPYSLQFDAVPDFPPELGTPLDLDDLELLDRC